MHFVERSLMLLPLPLLWIMEQKVFTASFFDVLVVEQR
jgi:hypothetical protein